MQAGRVCHGSQAKPSPSARRCTMSLRSDYEVGYGKPPRHTQFKKGQSDNPAGGRSRPIGLLEIAAKTLSRKVTVVVEGQETQSHHSGSHPAWAGAEGVQR